MMPKVTPDMNFLVRRHVMGSLVFSLLVLDSNKLDIKIANPDMATGNCRLVDIKMHGVVTGVTGLSRVSCGTGSHWTAGQFYRRACQQCRHIRSYCLVTAVARDSNEYVAPPRK